MRPSNPILAFAFVLLACCAAAQTPVRLTTGGALNSAEEDGIVDVGGKVFFSGPVPGLRTLWNSDGTVAGTGFVRSFASGLRGDTLYGAEWDGKLVFGANDTATSYLGQLWSSDGTFAGTTWLADAIPGPSTSTRPGFVRMGNVLYFNASTATDGSELWRTDGTVAGTYRVRDINPSMGSSPLHLTAFKGHLYFSADDGTGYRLWRSDGTSAGTQIFAASIPANTFLGYFAVLGDVLLIPSSGQLYRTDGTTAGTVLVKTIDPSFRSVLAGLTVVGGEALFTCDDGVTGRELWKTDGTAAGTVLVKDINPGAASSTPGYLTESHGVLLFSATAPGTGTELWRSDGTTAGTVLVKDINPGAAHGRPAYITAVGSRRVYFLADDGANGGELWQSDGTAAGTSLVADLYVGSAGSQARGMSLSGGLVYFKANQPASFGRPDLFAFDPGASAQPYGFGCAATVDPPTLASTDPVLGGPATLSGTYAPSTLGLLMLGVPFRTGLQYAPGCRFWLDLTFGIIDVFVFPVGGVWSLDLPIPGDASLMGVQLGAQAGFPQSGAPLNIAVTNGVLLRLGS